jgi:hypothetical protein
MDSGFGDFFSQIPSIFIIMFCGSGVLLLVALGAIVRTRGRQRAAVVAAPAGAAIYPSYGDIGDLPDLDDLASSVPVTLPASPVQAASAAKARPNGAYSVALAGGEAVEAVEVLTVLRDVAEGGLIIQIGDKAYRNPPAYADPEFKRRLNTTLRDLKDATTASAAKVESVAAVVADEMDTPAVVAEMPPLPAAESAAAAQSVPPPTAPASERLSPHEPAPGDLPKFRMPDTPIKPKRGKRPEPEPIPEINIAGSIEAFLQHKLVRTPDYSRRSIHVVPAAHGAVKIEVDGTYYDSVSEVEDVAVRQFLSATIEEWQSRQ